VDSEVSKVQDEEGSHAAKIHSPRTLFERVYTRTKAANPSNTDENDAPTRAWQAAAASALLCHYTYSVRLPRDAQ